MFALFSFWGATAMKKIRHATATLALSCLSLAGLSQTFAQQPAPASSKPFGLEPGNYSVGFQLLVRQDPSREVTGGIASAPHPRPIRIYLWYPAKNTRPAQRPRRLRQAAQPMRFSQYAALAKDDIWPPQIAGRLRAELKYSRRPLARSLGQARFEALLQRPVLAVENAAPLEGPYPLIVIGQGLYYESPIAFAAMGEYLASRGFVVATTPLVGTNSPLVKLDGQDLETQVRDLEFVIAQARRLPLVSPKKLGVLGFDMGGMVGLILAMRNPDVDAFVSLDSGILYRHPSGLPRTLPSYDPFALDIPWLCATGVVNATPPPHSQAKSLFEQAVHSNRYLLFAKAMGHVDFTSYALVEGRRAVPGYWAAGSDEVAANHRIVANYVYNFFAAFLRHDAESLALLSQDPKRAFPGSKMTLAHRAATLPSISYDEFVQAVVAGKGEQAIDKLRSIAAAEPDNYLLGETHLERLAFSLVYTWGLVEEAIPVMKFTVERYPSSVTAERRLLEGYLLVQDYPAAITLLRRYVEQHPKDAYAQSQLKSLLSRNGAKTK